MHKVSLQTAFNRVWKWFVIKKKPFGYNSKANSCLYKGPKRTMCAFAVALPPHLRSLLEEGQVAPMLIQRESDLYNALEEPNSLFWGHLQDAHDMAATSHGDDRLIEPRLRKLAEQYALTIPGGVR